MAFVVCSKSYSFLLPTLGHALPSGCNPISPDTVFVAVTPSAPPSLAARAILRMSVMFGVILAKNGIFKKKSLFFKFYCNLVKNNETCVIA